MTIPWSQQQLFLLNQILDQLIPANPEKNIPSAGEVGVASFITAESIADEQTLIAVDGLLKHADSMGENVDSAMVERLEMHNPEGFASFIRLTYMGYYSQPQIRAAVGIAEWPVHPKGYEVPVEPTHLLDQLTAPVIKRGKRYRDPKMTQETKAK